jgi:hypothetical protein
MNSAALVIRLLATFPIKITQADISTTNNHRQHKNGIPSNSGIGHYAIPLFLDSKCWVVITSLCINNVTYGGTI